MAARRRRVLLGTLAVLAAAGAAAPYYTGLQVQGHFRAWLERLRASPRVRVEEARYERGWGEARARTALTLHLPDRTLHLAVEHRIEHGPRPGLAALARITSTPEAPPSLRPLVRRLFADRPPVEAVTTIGFDGSPNVVIHSPSFDATLRDDDPTRVRWEGLEVQMRAHAHRLRLHGRAPGLTLATQRASLHLQGWRSMPVSGRVAGPGWARAG